jgi:transcriptional regulator with GAF, ATPase, and Fis domain
LRETDLLLRVWREACRHIELEQSIEGIARVIAPHVGADHIVVRQVDLIHGGLDTVALARCRPGAPPVVIARSNLTDAGMHDVLAWCRDSEAATGSVPGDGILDLLRPADFRGHCLAAPLHADDGPLGVVLLLSQRTPFKPADPTLLAHLREPIEIALANTAHLRELKRLRESLEADKQALLSKLGRHDVADAVVGAETGLRAVMDRVEHVAGTDVPVLIMGETGSGKEVLARTLHERSRRARSPLVRVNCGAIPPGLVDAELFGHERGGSSLTARQGWFERADGGTLFLDEISELSLEAQVRVLRILQGGTFERVGGEHPLSADVRIIGATHRDLRAMVAQGAFREDLWHRISVFPIHLPPLRERREDIPRLAAHFAARAATRLVGVPVMPTREDLDLLLAYDWPGNVRELAAVIERAVILGAGRTLHIAAALGSAAPRAPVSSPPADLHVVPPQASAVETIDAAMRRHIELALQATGGRVEGTRGAARALAINPHTLRARMKKLGIVRGRFRGTPSRGVVEDSIVPLDDAMADHIRQVLEATAGRIEGPHGAAQRLGINPHTLRARMRKLGLVAAQFRRRAASARSAG